MILKTTILACLLLFAVDAVLVAQENKMITKASPKDSAALSLLKPQKSVTRGSVTVEGHKINYKAIAGTLILKSKDHKPACSMFYVAYFKDGVSDESKRPVTFIYNGGPGVPTSWLHICAWGPRLAYLKDTQRISPPYKTVNNDYSLLDASDLVFIDAPGTGFSRVLTKKEGGAGDPKDFYGTDQDAAAFAAFIMQFLSDYNCWDSPKYLYGESYGTFRSAALSYLLEVRDAVVLNGVILQSQILAYSNGTDQASMIPGDNQHYELALPSYAATGWYYHKLPGRPRELLALLKGVEHFAMNDYALALNKGALLDSAAFNQIAKKLHQYTGLPENYIRKAGLRISVPQFEHTLLDSGDRITGNLDARFQNYAFDPLSENTNYDPTDSYIDGPIRAIFNNYIRKVLQFGKGHTYKMFNSEANNMWDFRHQAPGNSYKFFANVMPDLAQAMIYNPKLEVMLNSGFFDLNTPYFEGMYEMRQLPIPEALQKNIEIKHYYSGHLIYLNPKAHKQLHDNVATFIESTH